MKSFAATLALLVTASAFAGTPQQCLHLQDAVSAKAGLIAFEPFLVETDSGYRSVTSPDGAIEYFAPFCEQARKQNPRLGMSATIVILNTSWGKPDSINRTKTKYGIHEQWVYGNSYLYFDNGVLTAAQN